MEFTFKTNKTERVLIMYQRLLQGEYIDKTSFIIEHGINERTFDRDIEEIRMFLCDMYSTNELKYDLDLKSYYLTEGKTQPLDLSEAAIILKILLGSKTLRQDEMYGIVNSIFSQVNKNDRKELEQYFFEEIKEYTSSESVALIKLTSDLYYVLTKGYDIEINIKNTSNEIYKEIVCPLEILFFDMKLYLIAISNFSNAKISKYPLNTIISFKTLNSSYKKSRNLKNLRSDGYEY